MLLSAGTLAFSSAAMAQEAAPAPSPAAPSSTAANVSDADIQKFAKAAVELEQIKADTAVPEESKQPLMLAAVQKQGLDPEKFNSIAQAAQARSEEHTSELQSLMRISYAVFCLKKKKNSHNNTKHARITPEE